MSKLMKKRRQKNLSNVGGENFAKVFFFVFFLLENHQNVNNLAESPHQQTLTEL